MPTRLPARGRGRSSRCRWRHDLHSLAVLLAVDVREGEDELFVHLVREEDAVEDERESKADEEDRSVVEVVLVGEVGVTQERVAVDGLRREGGDNKEEQGPAGDEEVLSLPPTK